MILGMAVARSIGLLCLREGDEDRWRLTLWRPCITPGLTTAWVPIESPLR